MTYPLNVLAKVCIIRFWSKSSMILDLKLGFPWLVAFFWAICHPGKCCLFALEVIFARCGIDEASSFIQSLHQITTIIPYTWFSPATDFLMAKFITDFTTATLAKSTWPWSSEIAAFVYQLFGPYFYVHPDERLEAARCRAVFRQCIQEMDDDTSIYRVWLFTQTNMPEELERVHRAKRSKTFRIFWSTAIFFFFFWYLFFLFMIKLLARRQTRTWACRWWRWRWTWTKNLRADVGFVQYFLFLETL